jgi:hypothetical protein
VSEGLYQKDLTYHEATGLGERSTSTKHILGIMVKQFRSKDPDSYSPTIARDRKSVMVTKPEHMFEQ